MPSSSRPTSRTNFYRAGSAVALAALFVGGPLSGAAHADVERPPLGTAANFSVLGGSAVTNTGISTIAQDLGVSPGSSLPEAAGANALNVLGARHQTDTVAAQAQLDLTAAYDNARGQIVPTIQDAELGGETKVGGIYKTPVTNDMGLTGQLTLDGANNPDSIWVFQVGRDLNIASGASMTFIRGANPCNVYWQVDRTATLGTSSRMTGTIMALTSIVMQNSATLQGRLLARNAEITMDTNVITQPLCQPVYATPTTPVVTPPASPAPTTPDTTGGTAGSDTPGTDGGTGSAGGGYTGTGTGTGTNTFDDQIKRTPTGSVDTGYVGPVSSEGTAGGLLGGGLFALVGGLAMLAVRRRRSV